jgi:glycosyltransferase involved in cell wall biosynthesis
LLARVLLVHNRYQQRGGEEAVVLAEQNLLGKNGFAVEFMEADNDQIVDLGGKLKASATVFHNFSAVSKLRGLLQKFKPDLVHVHNWFPSLSPAIFRTCKREGVPVVHTLHNYRLLCAKATLFREGAVCEECIDTKFRLPGIRHGCYRGSRSGTAVATSAILSHWHLGTWRNCVDRFIALSEFARRKMEQGGLPRVKISVKPNFLDFDPGARPGNGNFFVFAGRLSEEKGVLTLLDAWRAAPHLPTLKIFGTGPEAAMVKAAASSIPNVELCGQADSATVLNTIGNASALICPSRWYEGMPRVVIEALAVGTPVIASRIGVYREIITDPDFGFLFDPGNPVDLIRCASQLNDSGRLGEMRREARAQFEKFYSAKRNMQILAGIYSLVLGSKKLGETGLSLAPSQVHYSNS